MQKSSSPSSSGTSFFPFFFRLYHANYVYISNDLIPAPSISTSKRLFTCVSRYVRGEKNECLDDEYPSGNLTRLVNVVDYM